MSLSNNCFADASNKIYASCTFPNEMSFEKGMVYSKKPLPAPFTFSPSNTSHCFCDQVALVNFEGATSIIVVLSLFTSLLTTKCIKLVCNTFPKASFNLNLIIPKPANAGTLNSREGNCFCIHG